MNTLDGVDEGLTDEFVGAGNVLLSTAALSSDGDRLCTELLAGKEESDRNVLWVSYAAASKRIDRFREHTGGPATDATAIVVEGAGPSGGEGEAGGLPDGVDRISAGPNDLTQLGIAVTEQLQEWADGNRRAVVCFDSLTALLQYSDRDAAYEFLHVVTGRIRSVDAVAHFHFDPSAHDDQTFAQVATLMDAVVEVDDGDGISVRTR